MSRSLTLATVTIIGLAAAWIFSNRGHKKADRRERFSDDCAVDECGADGLPLNAYSG